MSVKWLRDVPTTTEGLQASYADLERQMPTRLEGWRASVQTALTEQWVDAQAAIAELPPSKVTGVLVEATIQTAIAFVDGAKDLMTAGIAMVTGQMIFTDAHRAKVPGARFEVESYLEQQPGVPTRETLSITYGGEALGTVTRISGGGERQRTTLGVEVTLSPAALRASQRS